MIFTAFLLSLLLIFYGFIGVLNWLDCHHARLERERVSEQQARDLMSPTI